MNAVAGLGEKLEDKKNYTIHAAVKTTDMMEATKNARTDGVEWVIPSAFSDEL